MSRLSNQGKQKVKRSPRQRAGALCSLVVWKGHLFFLLEPVSSIKYSIHLKLICSIPSVPSPQQKPKFLDIAPVKQLYKPLHTVEKMPFNPSQLTRVQLRKNPNYQRHGRKSYAYALQKCTHSPSPLLSQSTDLKQDNIGPTLEGPFAMIDQIEQTGSQAVMRTIGKKIGGKAYSKGQTLVMRDASGKSVPVPTTDVQHDSMYLSDVGVGTPKQMLKLDFDTGSADCWVLARLTSLCCIHAAANIGYAGMVQRARTRCEDSRQSHRACHLRHHQKRHLEAGIWLHLADPVRRRLGCQRDCRQGHLDRRRPVR